MGMWLRARGMLLSLVALGCAAQSRGPVALRPQAEQWEVQCRTGQVESCYDLAWYLLDEKNQGASYEQALVALELGCSHGSERSCGLLGAVFVDSNDGPTEERGRRLLDGACNRHVARACFILAGQELEQHTAAGQRNAMDRYLTACRLSDGEGCFELGRILTTGNGVAVDRTQGVFWLQRACELNSAEGCHSLAAILDVMDHEDLGRREQLESHACQLGRAESCVWVAQRHIRPDAGNYDCKRGQLQAAQACQMGSAEGCGLFSICVDRRLPSIDPNHHHLYEACNQGSASGCLYLARLVGNGDGSPQSQEESLRLYSHACRLASVAGCRTALKMSSGDARAGQFELVHLIQSLCQREQREACLLLAGLYEEGKVVARDLDLAERLRAKACREDDLSSCPASPPNSAP